MFATLSNGRASAALAAAKAATFYHLFSSPTPPSPVPLCQPPSYRVMELPTQKQDMVYKWDAEGEAISSCWKLWAGYHKTTVVANTAPLSVVRVITPKQEAGEGKNSASEGKGEFSCEELVYYQKKEGGWKKTVSVNLFYLQLRVTHWFTTSGWNVYKSVCGRKLKD